VAREHEVAPDHGDEVAGKARGAATPLTPAEEHALRRSAPLTPMQFEELGRLAARGINPLRRL
jgi:hypothetical protein